MSRGGDSTVLGGESVVDRLVHQLTLDYESISRDLEVYQSDRLDVVEKQKLAMAAYDMEIADIEAEFGVGVVNQEESTSGLVDHNILRHLNIEKDSDAYKRFENPFPTGQPEKVQKNIEELQNLQPNQVKPPPTQEEKASMRGEIFNFMDEARMEETRLELEYEEARKQGDYRLLDELGEALFILQKDNCNRLSDMVADYRPAAFGKVWGDDDDYNHMLRNLTHIAEEGGGTGNNNNKKKKAPSYMSAKRTNSS
mmetsp:Transcript_2313/g.3648  ORF Transcript_2313/g.3648 Transcript_2313/m.3648 type:complete len:254 (-) Transcript_2313:113-874(-)|eukprot:CAMPEP_0174975050 /NCGR_PEP_ID=MMETSP0004_2-20121128/12215_1 /TAXON_ID=420556 /ORGANISM="Ochromonas sp., Strain CCMP1393" /LENGTH=253 /DNA_ID=CAMNT_0016225833 /DNA_START=16 /DNA_END=777 /DNA_ORIENTATION=-